MKNQKFSILEWHKGRVNWFKKKTGISDYGLHWYSFIKGVIIGVVIMLLTGCGTIPAVVGTSASTYETYKTVTFVKGGVDLSLVANDKKTTDDFMLSKITGYDCKVSRILKGEGIEAICKQLNILPQNKPGLDKKGDK
jgi:hypothetical protein